MKLLTQDQIKSVFGDPTVFLNMDGTPNIGWERAILTIIQLPAPIPYISTEKIMINRVSCHKKIAPHLSLAMNELFNIPEAWATIDDWGGCYNWRKQRGSRNLSTHCWGIAVDFDVADNLLGDTTPEIHPETKRIMEKHGFYGGYQFHANRTDGMHWEFANLELL